MKGPNASETGVATEENEAGDKGDKRDRNDNQEEIVISQQAGQASGTEEERPFKTRKVVSDADTENNDPEQDDPVALARRALDMFRQEVESDGDYSEPDTTPREMDDILPIKNTIPSAPPGSSSKSNQPTTSKTVQPEPQGSRWQKTGRQPMIFAQDDDPSIL